jgi:small GTP-binding protein
MTIGVDFEILPYFLHDQEIVLQLFDLGGQQRFQFMHRSYIKGAKVAIVLYDLTRSQSFENLPQWFDILLSENPEIPIILAGTKKDVTSMEDLHNATTQWMKFNSTTPYSKNIKKHLYISSKTYEGIDALFDAIGDCLVTVTPSNQFINRFISTEFSSF